MAQVMRSLKAAESEREVDDVDSKFNLHFPPGKVGYDYLGGMEDIKKAKVRTVIPARTSFQENCARILRGIRIAARLGFGLSKETTHFVKNLSCSVLRLDKGRLLMEINYMLAYGSAEASLRLLWKFGLLDILLPFQVDVWSIRQNSI